MKTSIWASAAILAIASFANSQSVSPPGLATESSDPFSYYLVPSDEIGFKDCPMGFQVTYEGDLNNGFGEMDFEAGSPARPINQRVKTLYRGYMPMVRYGFNRDGARYDFEVFGAPPNLDPREDLVAFVRLRVSNPGKNAIDATFLAAYGPRHGDARAALPCRAWYQAKFMDEDVFKKSAASMMLDGEANENGHLVFLYSGEPSLDPTHLAVEYHFHLDAGQAGTALLRVPFVPISVAKGDVLSSVTAMSADRTFSEVVAFWDAIFERALQIDVDDPKVVNTMRSSLAYDLIARDIEADGEHFTQTVNKFQYHDFFMRDTSFIARSYELLNLPDIARTTIEKYLVRDSQGKVVKFLRLSPDDWGQSLWAVGSYFRSTGDVEFAKMVHPAIAPHLDEFVERTSKDPLGLWTVAGPYDNELIDGHYTSHNLWALLGLEEAENLCRAIGDVGGAQRAHDLYVGFRKVFLSRLAALTAKDEGYIPPGMDNPDAGNDWENATGGVYPFHVLPPFHPWVTATIDMEREYKYREGIMTWGPNAWKGKQAAMNGSDFDPQYLHDYETFQVDETLLAREEQRKVVEDLYSTLVHTSSSNAGFETSIRPWGDRNPDDNFPPHGWFAARYNELLRNMLLREDGDVLHIASALAPQWIMPGKVVRVRHGANSFGTIDFTISARSDGALVDIQAGWRKPPARLMFHVPWFVRLISAKADGNPVRADDGAISLPPTTRRLLLTWRWTEHPDLSYGRAVKLWLQKAYQPKPGDDMDLLFPAASGPRLVDTNLMFASSYALRLTTSDGGVIHYTLDGSAPTLHSPVYTAPVRIDKSATVRAVEVLANGHLSEPMAAKLTKAAFRDPGSPGDVDAGVSYSYYEQTFQAMPDFGALTPVRTGVAPIPDLDAIQHRSELFALDIRGYVKVPHEGIYTFWTGSDDGSKLWIGDELVVDNDGPHPYSEVKGRIPLRAGFYPIHIEYFDAGGANYLHFFWAGPGIAKEKVPASALFHGR